MIKEDIIFEENALRLLRQGKKQNGLFAEKTMCLASYEKELKNYYKRKYVHVLIWQQSINYFDLYSLEKSRAKRYISRIEELEKELTHFKAICGVK